MEMAAVQQSILDDLTQLGDPMSQLEYFLACARAHQGIPPEDRRDADLVPSCQAKTWVTVRWAGEELDLRADSESFLVRGALALLCEVYHRRTRAEIAAFSCALLDHPAFTGRLTGEQRRGLESIVRQLHRQAEAKE